VSVAGAGRRRRARPRLRSCRAQLNEIDSISIEELELLDRVPHYVPVSRAPRLGLRRHASKRWARGTRPAAAFTPACHARPSRVRCPSCPQIWEYCGMIRICESLGGSAASPASPPPPPLLPAPSTAGHQAARASPGSTRPSSCTATRAPSSGSATASQGHPQVVQARSRVGASVKHQPQTGESEAP